MEVDSTSSLARDSHLSYRVRGEVVNANISCVCTPIEGLEEPIAAPDIKAEPPNRGTSTVQGPVVSTDEGVHRVEQIRGSIRPMEGRHYLPGQVLRDNNRHSHLRAFSITCRGRRQRDAALLMCSIHAR